MTGAELAEARRLALALNQEQAVVDSQFVQFILRAFRIARQRLQPTISAAIAKIDDALHSNLEPDPVLIRRALRLDSLSQEIKLEMGAFSDVAAAKTLIEKEDAGSRSLASNAVTVRAITQEAVSIPRLSQALIDSMADGTPVSAFFAEFGPEAAADAKTAITSGVLARKPIRTIASDLEGVLDIPRPPPQL